MIATWTQPAAIADLTDDLAVLVTYWGTAGDPCITDCERLFFLEGL